MLCSRRERMSNINEILDNCEPDDDGPNQQQLEAVLDKHLVMLSEHFDSVRIFATRPCNDGSTDAVSRGVGNYFAQRGAIDDWTINQRELTKLQARE